MHHSAGAMSDYSTTLHSGFSEEFREDWAKFMTRQAYSQRSRQLKVVCITANCRLLAPQAITSPKPELETRTQYSATPKYLLEVPLEFSQQQNKKRLAGTQRILFFDRRS